MSNKKKKRIAHFGIKYFPSKGGTSRVVESIVQSLKDDYEITIYCYKNEEAIDYIPGVRIIFMPEIPFGTAGVFLYYTLCCLHILFHKGYDIIHVHKTECAFFLPFLRLKGKLAATSHELPYRRDKWSAIEKAYFHLMERFFIYSPATLTAVSEPLKTYYEARYKTNVHFIPNGVEITDARNKNAAIELLASHGVEGPYVFFAARRIMGTKGAHTMLEGLIKAGYQGTVVIAGDTAQLPEYTEKIRKLSSKLNVKFIGYIGNKGILFSLIEMADYFIFPSETEGLSIMLLEVASVGTPIIASNIPENTAVFSDEDVLFFENKSSDDLAEKFVWANGNREILNQKAATAKAKVYSQYNSPQVAKKYAEFYETSV